MQIDGDNVAKVKIKYIEKEILAKIKRLKLEQAYCEQEGISYSDFLEADDEIDFQSGYYFYKQRYESIKNASFWKVTEPIRRGLDTLSNIRHGKQVLKNDSEKKEESSELSFHGEISTVVVIYVKNIAFLKKVVLRLQFIKEKFDIYLFYKNGTCPTDFKSFFLVLDYLNNLKIHNYEESEVYFNGKLPQNIFNYEIMLFIHQELTENEEGALNAVLKDKKTVEKIFEYFRKKLPRAGLIFEDTTSMLSFQSVFHRDKTGEELLEKLGIEDYRRTVFYPYNGFFWIKIHAVALLHEQPIEWKTCVSRDFLKVLPIIVNHHGYVNYLFNPIGDSFLLEKSRSFFKKYYEKNIELNLNPLKGNQIRVFDIFNTLITCLLFDDRDIIRLTEQKITRELRNGFDFCYLRKTAEKRVRVDKAENGYTIDDIYKEISMNTKFTQQNLTAIKEIEIELYKTLCIPRKRVVQILNAMQNNGEKIILLNNSILNENDVRQILATSGIGGNYEIIRDCLEIENRQGAIRYYTSNQYYKKELLAQKNIEIHLLLSSQDQFYLSNQFGTFEKFVGTTLENSLMLGVFVNQYLYNSPFALKEGGISQLESMEAVGAGIFAPLFLAFAEYIQNTSNKDSEILFLAREGYFLMQLYEQYCNSFGLKMRSHLYFFASRRAASVPQIENFEDIEELLTSQYKGRLSTLMEERFGLKKDGEDVWIESLETDKLIVFEELKTKISELISISEKEKELYLEYVKQELGDLAKYSNLTLVDVGYSGSIQYYLMKMMKHRLDGCYLATEKKMKPDKLGATYRGLYNFWEHPIFAKSTLFIESITAAPHGQVINFSKTDETVTPNLKSENNEAFDKAQILQNAIFEYIRVVGKVTNGIAMSFDKELALKIFEEIYRDNIISDKIKQIFSVNDEYCNDGVWIFESQNKEWKIH